MFQLINCLVIYLLLTFHSLSYRHNCRPCQDFDCLRFLAASAGQLALKALRARRRLKAIINVVLENLYWLRERDEDTDVLSPDVAKNVILLTKKKPTKGALQLSDKLLLSKSAELRTESEKILLNRIIGSLNCFKRYSDNVKAHLAAVTYFVYYGPGRVIIKQGDPPFGLYFILKGEVNISQITIDPLLNEEVVNNLGNATTGYMFGEVSLLHGIERTATITTVSQY